MLTIGGGKATTWVVVPPLCSVLPWLRIIILKSPSLRMSSAILLLLTSLISSCI